MIDPDDIKKSMGDFMRRTSAAQEARNASVTHSRGETSMAKSAVASLPSTPFARATNRSPIVEEQRTVAAPVPYAAFYRTYQSGGRHYLQGGQVSGSIGGNETINDINLGSTSSPPANGTRVWVKVTGDGNDLDGVLYPGFKVTNATTGSGSSIPANSAPTAASPDSKDYHILLGIWNGGTFAPSTTGNIQVGFCGSYEISRF